MKMNQIKRFLTVFGLAAVIFTACDKEEEEVFHKPVVDEDFTVTVVGNDVNLVCNMTTATAYLWELSTGDQSTDKVASVYIPLEGEYSVVLSVSNGGDYLASEVVTFTIDQTDDEYFNQGIWKALTGGANGTKTWVLDIEKKFFHNPLDFYGDEGAGLDADGNSWGPWGGTSIYDWGGTPEDGEISFVATSGMVTLTIDGVPTTGGYKMTPFDRPEDFITPALPAVEGVVPTLWDNMLGAKGKYKYMGSLSAQMADMKFDAGLRFPMDVGRITNDANVTNPSQFLTEDLENVVIMHCSDSALVVRVKRSFEGDNPSTCWLLYNYIVKEYTYPAKVINEPVHKSFSTADLVGTWKYAPVPYDWIGWAEADLLNNWADTSAIASWAPRGAEVAAAYDDEFDFKADGTCVLNGIANTFVVSEGVITFGTALTTEFAIGWFSLTGTEIKVIDVKNPASYDGIWIGIKNGEKDESSAMHLVKK